MENKKICSGSENGFGYEKQCQSNSIDKENFRSCFEL